MDLQCAGTRPESYTGSLAIGSGMLFRTEIIETRKQRWQIYQASMIPRELSGRSTKPNHLMELTRRSARRVAHLERRWIDDETIKAHTSSLAGCRLRLC